MNKNKYEIVLNKDQIQDFLTSTELFKKIDEIGDNVISQAKALSGNNYESDLIIFANRAEVEIYPVKPKDMVSEKKHKWLIKAIGKVRKNGN